MKQFNKILFSSQFHTNESPSSSSPPSYESPPTLNHRLINCHVPNCFPIFLFCLRMQFSYLLHLNMCFYMCPCPAALLQSCFAVSSKLLPTVLLFLDICYYVKLNQVTNIAIVSAHHKIYIDCQNFHTFQSISIQMHIRANEFNFNSFQIMFNKTMHSLCIYCQLHNSCIYIISGSTLVYFQSTSVSTVQTECVSWIRQLNMQTEFNSYTCHIFAISNTVYPYMNSFIGCLSG